MLAVGTAVLQVPGVAIAGPEGEIVALEDVGAGPQGTAQDRLQEEIHVGADHALADIVLVVASDAGQEEEPRPFAEPE